MNLAFAAPWVLARTGAAAGAVVAALRVVPPSPRRRVFPPLRILRRARGTGGDGGAHAALAAGLAHAHCRRPDRGGRRADAEPRPDPGWNRTADPGRRQRLGGGPRTGPPGAPQWPTGSAVPGARTGPFALLTTADECAGRIDRARSRHPTRRSDPSPSLADGPHGRAGAPARRVAEGNPAGQRDLAGRRARQRTGERGFRQDSRPLRDAAGSTTAAPIRRCCTRPKQPPRAFC